MVKKIKNWWIYTSSKIRYKGVTEPKFKIGDILTPELEASYEGEVINFEWKQNGEFWIYNLKDCKKFENNTVYSMGYEFDMDFLVRNYREFEVKYSVRQSRDNKLEELGI